MKGKYHIIVQNGWVRFEFDIKRNITIIRGDSATGKTTLVSMIDVHDRLGENSGIDVICDKRCITLNNSNWDIILENTKDCIVFIDEENTIIKTEDFARKVKGSDNYYVIVTRENLKNLPYSVDEVYGIHSSGKYQNMRQTYNSFYHLYSFDNNTEGNADIVVTEDSNAGHEFFSGIINESKDCISAGGKSNIRKILIDNKGKQVLVIADGAAFGSEMGELYPYIRLHKEVKLYLPESFEWIILASGLIDGKRISDILEHSEDFVESKDYFSWEQFYTSLLVQETEGTYLQYSKSKLNSVYLDRKERGAIVDVIRVINGIIGQDK